MAELLFAQLVMTLKRYRYAIDNACANEQEALLVFRTFIRYLMGSTLVELGGPGGGASRSRNRYRPADAPRRRP